MSAWYAPELGCDCGPLQYAPADKREFSHHVYVSMQHKMVITTIPKVLSISIARMSTRNWAGLTISRPGGVHRIHEASSENEWSG